MRHLFKRFWTGLAQSGRTLTQRTARGVAWVMMSSACEQVIGLVQTLIIVRLLSTLHLGIYRIAGIAIIYCRILTETGFSQALVQRAEINREVLDTAWIVQIARNAAQFAALFLLAGPIAAYCRTPAVAPVLQVIAFRFVFLAFRNPAVALMKREMKFKRYEIFERTYNLIGTAVTLVAAFVTRSYWALVIGQLVLAMSDTVGSYVLRPYRPGLRWRLQYARELVGFGKHIYLSGILGGLSRTLDEILLGRLLPLQALGVYGTVKNLAARPMALSSMALQRVLFPAYARIQRQPERLGRSYARMLGLVALVFLPVYVGMILVAPSLIGVLLTERFQAGVPAFMIFCGICFFDMIRSTTAPLFAGVGKPHLNWIGFLISLTAFVPALVLLAPRYGATGAASAQAVRTFGTVCFAAWMLHWSVGIDLRRAFAHVWRPALGALVMTLALLPAVLWGPDRGVLPLGILSAAGALVYLNMTFWINEAGVAELRAAAKGLLSEQAPEQDQRKDP